MPTARPFADLAVIAANHVISMVDAFATMRLQVRAEADGRYVDWSEGDSSFRSLTSLKPATPVTVVS